MKIDPERLAYWYLRLNGFLTIENFLVHPERARDNSTEIDVLGVRFAHRRENLARPMEDDLFFTNFDTRHLVAIVEVKNSLCCLNGPWTDPASGNMNKVMAAVGALPERVWEEAAQSLYTAGVFDHVDVSLRLVCFGRFRNTELEQTFPEVPQITFEQALSFVHERFRKYRDEKAAHDQWSQDGKDLWNAAARYRDLQRFLANVSVDVEGSDRPSRSRAELRAASDHLFYEIWMLLGTLQALSTAHHGTVHFNALLESLTVHARALIQFFYPRRAFRSDVIATDFFTERPAWLTSRPPEHLSTARERVNKEIVHLTYDRQTIKPSEKVWDLRVLTPALIECTTNFLNDVPTSLLGDRWSSASAAELRSSLQSDHHQYLTDASTPASSPK